MTGLHSSGFSSRLTKLRTFTGDVATVFIGKDKTRFVVHAKLLISCSPFFEKALRGEFQDKTMTVTLPEDEPDTFATFLRWLYSDTIDVSEQKNPFTRVVRLWVLADRLQIPTLKNKAMRLIPAAYQRQNLWSMTTATVNWLYSNTTAGSPMRRVFVDLAVGKASLATLKSGTSAYCREFVDEVCQEFLKRVAQPQVLGFDRVPEFIRSLEGYLVDENGQQSRVKTR